MHNHLISKKRIPTCFIKGKPTLYPFSFLQGKLLMSQESVQVLQKELDDYHQTHMKLAMESTKKEYLCHLYVRYQTMSDDKNLFHTSLSILSERRMQSSCI